MTTTFMLKHGIASRGSEIDQLHDTSSSQHEVFEKTLDRDEQEMARLGKRQELKVWRVTTR